jgi:hypothetical protein
MGNLPVTAEPSTVLEQEARPAEGPRNEVLVEARTKELLRVGVLGKKRSGIEHRSRQTL